MHAAYVSVRRFVANRITNFRQDLAQRQTEVAEHQHEQQQAILASTAQIGEEMRAEQRQRETGLLELSDYYLAEKRRRNLESSKLQTETLTQLFDSISMKKSMEGMQLREQRAQNTQTIMNVSAAELQRVQELNETVKKEQELSAARLRDKLDTTKRMQTAEYLKDRTHHFNQFKKAASVTNK